MCVRARVCACVFVCARARACVSARACASACVRAHTCMLCRRGRASMRKCVLAREAGNCKIDSIDSIFTRRLEVDDCHRLIRTPTERVRPVKKAHYESFSWGKNILKLPVSVFGLIEIL